LKEALETDPYGFSLRPLVYYFTGERPVTGLSPFLFSTMEVEIFRRLNMVNQIRSKKETSITSLEAFRTLADEYDLIPLVQEMNIGGISPHTLYRKLRSKGTHSFLLESGDQGKGGGRYSFIGIEPEKIFRVTAEGCEVMTMNDHQVAFYPSSNGLRDALNEYLECKRPPVEEGSPPFMGGVAGYFGYEMVEEWEDLFHESGRKMRSSCSYKSLLMGYTTVAAFDHITGRLFLINNIRIPQDICTSGLEKLYLEGIAFLAHLAESTYDREKEEDNTAGSFFLKDVHSHTPRNTFLEMIQKGRGHVIAGDICQVVLSQRFSAETDLPSLDIYQTLKEINPSPYLFYLELPGLELIGSSPEVLVKVEGDLVTTRPLAGTRRRGTDEEEDRSLAEELLADEKERAEHLMLVDLARNDLGRVCRTGTVKVTELMGLEYYSQVMHIVSQVEGRMKTELSPLDVLESAFPAGTVSGAPKIRAMEIIEEIEPSPRGPYAGAAGYMSFDGNLDTCIIIRTMIREGNTINVQAGAGVVYDSVPESEYEETRNKAEALLRALGKTLERRNRL